MVSFRLLCNTDSEQLGINVMEVGDMGYHPTTYAIRSVCA